MQDIPSAKQHQQQTSIYVFAYALPELYIIPEFGLTIKDGNSAPPITQTRLTQYVYQVRSILVQFLLHGLPVSVT